ncbi:MAG TPA: type IV pilus secretin PilQ [Gammaproteobacteria bacterium]|nr:type IV pilus secretin PilQ [Gammaproteobacteria bacterium]
MVPWRIHRITALFLLAVVQAVVLQGAAAAAVKVDKVELYEDNGTTGVLLAGDGELKYRLVSQQDPPRVIVQLPNADLAPEALPKSTSKGLVRNLRLHSANGGPPRLELVLARAAEATASREGTALHIALKPEGQSAGTGSASASGGSAPVKLEDYVVSRNDQGTSVLLKTTGKIPRFQSFQLDDPPRLVVDLYGVDLALPRSEYPVKHPFIDRIRFGEQSGRLRAVLDLKGRVTHSVKPSSQGLRLALTRPSSRERIRHIDNVDFTTGPEPRMARLSLKLDRTGAEVQVHREQDKVVMDLPKTRLPKRLEKRLVVTDFGTAVDTVDLYQKGDAVRVVASGDGPLQPRTYQLENRLVLDVAKMKKEQAAKRGPDATGKPYEGEKLSLNFQDIEVRQALQILAEFADINIIASESVGGSLTLRLQEVPWDQALDLILDSQGLGMERTGNVIRVAPKAELQKQREQDLKAEMQQQQLVPLQTELIQVNYAKASEVKSLLESQQGGGGGGSGGAGPSGILSQRGSVTVDDRTNSLIVRDTPDQIRRVKQLVSKLDRPTKQVMIEARIVKIDTSFERNLGIRWGGLYTSANGQNRFSGSLAGAQASTPDLAVDLPVGGAAGGGPATVGMRLGSIGNNATLDLELQAIEAEGNGKVISSPRVVTANQQQATIEQGTEIPYQQATSSGATSVSFKKAVLSLDVTPQITPDGRLIMDVNASNDTVGQNTVAGPAIDTEEVETQVLVDDGETIVIGGIYAKSQREDETGVPILRNIPLLGWLFQNKTTSTQKNELLIFLTPRVIEDSSESLAGSGGRLSD